MPKSETLGGLPGVHVSETLDIVRVKTVSQEPLDFGADRVSAN